MKRNGLTRSWLSPGCRGRIRLERVGRAGRELRWRASEGEVYYVYLDLTGKGWHHCTCANLSVLPFQKRRLGRGMFCRHIVAAAMEAREPALLIPLLAG
ncbi:MAG: hypothetical protein HY553_10850 [Elusimicrobia bacterium]|nr:hypothetical protein [Elusimicrobiota bacterium]